MLKKWLSIIFAAVICLSSFCGITFAEEAEKATLFEGELFIVKKLGIIRDSETTPFDGEKTVTRGEFAEYLAKISGYSDIRDTTSGQVYSDVKKGDSCYYAVNMLHTLNVVKGTGMGLFNPDSPVLYRDALTLTVRLLGYEVIAEGMGGYPGGYFLSASQNNITNGISLGTEEAVNGKTLVRLLFNALNVQVMAQESYNNTGEIKLRSGETLLASVYNVYKTEGIITANQYTGLGSASEAAAENSVVIGGFIYSAGDTDISDKLGARVSFYYEDKLAYESLSEIIYYEYYNKDDKYHLNVAAEKITDAANYTIKYDESYGNSRTLSFNGNTYVIFNGIAYPGYSYSDLMPKMGGLTLTDNNSDGIYDVISVTSLTDYTVASVSSAFSKISVDNRDDFDFAASDVEYIIIKENKQVDYSQIYVNDVISVGESKDGSLVKIYASTASVTGTVTEIGEEDGIDYVAIDGARYPLSPTAAYSPVFGDYGTFYINSFGAVSDKSTADTNEQFGYLIKIGYSGVLDKEYKFKILTSRGITAYDPAKTLTLNGTDGLEPEEAATHNDLWTNGAKDEDGIVTEQQLIKFKTNAEGKLTHIYTYTDNTAQTDRKDKYDTEFTLDAKGSRVTYRSGNRALGTRYLVNASTIIFEAPEIASFSDDSFTSYNISRLTHDKEYSGVEFYSTNYENITGAVVMRSATKSAGKIPNYQESVIVTKVTIISEEGLQGTKIYGVLKGAEREYKCFDNSVGDYDPNYGNGVMLTQLKPGDVVQLSVGNDGNVDQMRLLFRKSGDIGYKLSQNESLTYMNMGLMSSTGKVMGSSRNVIIVNCYDGVTPEWDRTFMKNDKTHFFIFDTAKQKLTEVEPTDIDDGAMVYVRGSYSGLYDLIWYK